jgi:hypothetical protein
VAQGVDPVLLAPMGELLAKTVAAGHGDEDMAATIRMLRTGS